MVLRPDPVGALDIASGVLLWHTASPLPEVIAMVHAGFLLFKGIGTVVGPMPLGGAPVFVLGTAADMMSAAILVTGDPPLISGQVKQLISLGLFLKGVLGLPVIMG